MTIKGYGYGWAIGLLCQSKNGLAKSVKGGTYPDRFANFGVILWLWKLFLRLLVVVLTFSKLLIESMLLVILMFFGETNDMYKINIKKINIKQVPNSIFCLFNLLSAFSFVKVHKSE